MDTNRYKQAFALQILPRKDVWKKIAGMKDKYFAHPHPDNQNDASLEPLWGSHVTAAGHPRSGSHEVALR